ncbi:hypothetical protein M23134_00799 [Microscilla marina ATCC 23134]|uniref:Uncharacterized protein n=1 Tax=Microscilla marina ATCC 23134 TaxID=313606 RepID=A1ZVW3_MICM2|nr:hypothetical protein M23134_00799 [Microscilla marina ATCC 23134]
MRYFALKITQASPYEGTCLFLIITLAGARRPRVCQHRQFKPKKQPPRVGLEALA